jgi:hypothetical protein
MLAAASLDLAVEKTAIRSRTDQQEPVAEAPAGKVRYLTDVALRERLAAWETTLNDAAEFGLDVQSQLAMVSRFHKLIEELAKAPQQLSTRELAAAEGISQRTAQRRQRDMSARGPRYDRQKALAGAARGGRSAQVGGMSR